MEDLNSVLAYGGQTAFNSVVAERIRQLEANLIVLATRVSDLEVSKQEPVVLAPVKSKPPIKVKPAPEPEVE